MDRWRTEFWLAWRERRVQVACLVVLVLSSFAVIAGLASVSGQRALINDLEQAVADDRAYALAQQIGPGAAAYDVFHFTYDQPADLAFAAQGVRNDRPWKHRIRMLALEGQIYEADMGNPELSLAGRLDYAFVASVLVPLLLIVLLHDLVAEERRGNRFELLVATRGKKSLFATRAFVRALMLWGTAALPFVIGAIVAGAGWSGTGLVLVALAFNVAFWTVISFIAASGNQAGPTVAASLLGAWLALSLVVPTAGKLLAESTHRVPEGGNILLTRREAANDVRDQPKAATMQSFVKLYPEWAPYTELSSSFEWKWYYAVQHLSDQEVRPLSLALREGVAARDRVMGLVALISPPLLTERLITKAASTDVAANQRYDACVRLFHDKIRAFHYPMLFGTREHTAEAMAELPRYKPCTADIAIRP